MNFSNDKAIYVQIAERLSDEIQSGIYKDDERIPSVREYAVLLEVNANTTVKAYDLLATDEIIYNKRGLGYFVSAGAKKQIKKTRKKEFMKERLPELARQMQLLDISIDEVKEELEKNLKKIRYDDTIHPQIYIYSFCFCLIYNKVYVITFKKNKYACNFQKVASV